MFQQQKEGWFRQLLGVLFAKKKRRINNALRVSLAQPQDLGKIYELRLWSRAWLEGRSTRAMREERREIGALPGDQVLKVEFPNGGIVAGATLNIANTPAELEQQLGMTVPWVIFPVMTVRDVWSYPGTAYDKILRLVSLKFAHFLVVNGKTIAAQMGELAGSASGRFCAEYTHPSLRAKHWGEPIPSAPRAGNLIYKEAFLKANKDLIAEGIERHYLDAPLLWGEYLDPYMESKLLEAFEHL